MAEQMISVPSGLAKRKPETERRACVRLSTNQQFSCQPITGAKAQETRTGWLGRLRDISPGGAGLLLSQRFEPGSMLIVELEAKRPARCFAAQVVHATADESGHWIVGCEFIRPFSEEELHVLLQE
jgi:hypothetical protein